VVAEDGAGADLEDKLQIQSSAGRANKPIQIPNDHVDAPGERERGGRSAELLLRMAISQGIGDNQGPCKERESREEHLCLI
jgi:hypothetical protein